VTDDDRSRLATPAHPVARRGCRRLNFSLFGASSTYLYGFMNRSLSSFWHKTREYTRQYARTRWQNSIEFANDLRTVDGWRAFGCRTALVTAHVIILNTTSLLHFLRCILFVKVINIGCATHLILNNFGRFSMVCPLQHPGHVLAFSKSTSLHTDSWSFNATHARRRR
jgi:hypothetical protein